MEESRKKVFTREGQGIERITLSNAKANGGSLVIADVYAGGE